MLYVMLAITPTYPGSVERVIFNFNGNKEEAINYARAEQLASRGVKYKIEGPIGSLIAGIDKNMVLAIQYNINFQLVNNQAVQAGQVNAHNTGNNKPESPVNSAGFQELADKDLPIEDAIYGDAIPNTFGDIINVGGRSHER